MRSVGAGPSIYGRTPIGHAWRAGSSTPVAARSAGSKTRAAGTRTTASSRSPASPRPSSASPTSRCATPQPTRPTACNPAPSSKSARSSRGSYADLMPEGDTIHYAANRIRPVLEGHVPDELTTPHPRFGRDRWSDRLAGQAVRSVDAYGKHLFIRFANDLTIHSHLRMTGSWRVLDA